MDGDKTRAKSLDAGIVLVAVRLVDLALAAEFGLERLDRNAVGGLRTVAAALADEVVDKDALRRIRIQPALAAATFLGGAGLIVDQNGEAFDLAQLAVNWIQLAAMMDGRAFGEILAGIFAGIVRDDRKALGALGPDLMSNLRDGQAALGGLPAGHGDRVVVENLVGNADARRRRRPQCEQARMCVGTVTEILKDVGLAGEGRLADPAHAFGAHMRDRRGASA